MPLQHSRVPDLMTRIVPSLRDLLRLPLEIVLTLWFEYCTSQQSLKWQQSDMAMVEFFWLLRETAGKIPSPATWTGSSVSSPLDAQVTAASSISIETIRSLVGAVVDKVKSCVIAMQSIA